MNLDIKMVLVRDEKQLIEFTWRFCINSVFGSIYLEKAKRNNNEIMQINS